MGGWATDSVGGSCGAASGVVEEDGGGPAIRLKSLPLGLPVRGDGDGALPPPPGDDDAADDVAAIVAAVPATGEPNGIWDDAEVVETARGADMRLRSLPFGGGTMVYCRGVCFDVCVEAEFIWRFLLRKYRLSKTPKRTKDNQSGWQPRQSLSEELSLFKALHCLSCSFSS